MAAPAGPRAAFAFARYKNQAGYAAMTCEVEVRRDSGQLNILRVVAAVDSGDAISETRLLIEHLFLPLANSRSAGAISQRMAAAGKSKGK